MISEYIRTTLISMKYHGAHTTSYSISRLCLYAVCAATLLLSLNVALGIGEAGADADPFVTTWKTTSPGESITIPTYIAFGSHTIDWGDGTQPTTDWLDQTHVYEEPGTYTVSITGDFTQIRLYDDRVNAEKLVSIDSWGGVQWGTMDHAFGAASNMVYNATDAPDFSALTDLQYMFYWATSFNGSISSWNVSSVTSMKDMFAHATSFNQDLSDWDVSSVENMHGMFYRTTSFNGDISAWDVSSVTDMSNMFTLSDSFNGDISAWDVSSVTDMSEMFLGANSFNGDISAWDVSSVTDMREMFYDTASFDQNLGNWYIVLDSEAIHYDDAPGIIGSISAQNSFLDGQNPVYGIGPGGDSDSFELDGSDLVLKVIPTKNSYTVTVTSTGEFGSGNSRTFNIEISGLTNSPPTASAGSNQTVAEGSTVTLSGTASDGDSDALTYRWTHDQPNATISLANQTALSTTFTAPQVSANTTITFTLTVSDGINPDVTDQVRVTVTDSANSPPTTNAGQNQTVAEGSVVTLSGTAADPDPEDTLAYLWTSNWSGLSITDATTLAPSFTAPNVASNTTITFTFTATDDHNAAASDTMTVTVTDSANQPPAVSAGSNQTVAEGSTVTLSGMASDPDLEDTLTYHWSHNHPTLPVTINNASALDTTFTAPNVASNTTITFTLTATDQQNANGTDTTTITVTDSANQTPTVLAGDDQTVQEGQAVTLSGTASDPDPEDVLTYRWSHDPTTLNISLTNSTALSTTFTAPQVDANTTLTFTLTIYDGTDASSDSLNLTINDIPPALPPHSAFVTTWWTTTSNESITIPARGTYTIDWGDGTTEEGVSGSRTHMYGEAGSHTIRISDGIKEFRLAGSEDAHKLASINQWGYAKWRSMYEAFQGASDMTYGATDVPDLSGVTDARRMFEGASVFDGDLSGWDVSSVKRMSYMFKEARSFDSDLSGWDVSGATDMAGMFWKARSFDSDLSGWDVSSVTDMYAMFHYARSFDSDLSGWDVSGVTGMANMFSHAYAFDSDLSGWDVSGVTTMYAMFAGARSFDSDLSTWDVSGVADMADMFRSTGAFNSDISGWEISRDARITTMLYRADAFGQNLGEWYIIMQDTSIRPGDVPGIVGHITTINPYLDGQNPSYGIGTGGDSGHFEMESNALRLKSVPEGSGPYTVNVTSSGGYGTGNSRMLWITVSDSAGPAPPGPRDITGLTLASTAPGTADVSWDAPARTPDDYRVSWAKAGEAYLTWRNSDGNAFPTGPSYTITGLEEGEVYKVQVRARYSGGGPGPWSGEATITVSANTPPTVSAGPDQTVVEGNAVTLTGTASDADTGDTLAYLWSQSPASPAIAFTNATSISTTFTAPQVSSNTAITLTLTATDQHNATVSDTMTLTITDIPDTTIPPANNRAAGSPAITGTIRVGQTLTADTSSISDADGLVNATFAYQWLSNDGTATSEISGASSSNYTLAAGDLSKTIKVRVTFTDDAGNPESLTSAATSQVTPTVPGSPSISSVLPAARGELNVSWQAPTYDGGGSITGYTIQWKEATGSWSNSADVSEATATVSHYTITGLTDGTTYAVRVIATNQAGDGQPSSEATATPRNPRHVTDFTLSSTQPGTIRVDWSEPAEDPTNYRVSWAKVGERFPTLAASTGYAFPDGTSYTITGLEEGAEYKVKVRARYDSGGNGAWSDILTVTVASSG